MDVNDLNPEDGNKHYLIYKFDRGRWRPPSVRRHEDENEVDDFWITASSYEDVCIEYMEHLENQWVGLSDDETVELRIAAYCGTTWTRIEGDRYFRITCVSLDLEPYRALYKIEQFEWGKVEEIT